MPEGRALLPNPLPDAAKGRSVAQAAAAAVKATFAEAVRDHGTFREEETLLVDPARLPDICRFLKESAEFAFIYLVDITASHWMDRDHEYEVAYLLCSLRNNALIRLKVRVGGPDPALPRGVPTVTGVWGAADWMEREEWDKVGVVFDGHPNLKRILMPEDWEGHPLRRDYPMEGIGA